MTHEHERAVCDRLVRGKNRMQNLRDKGPFRALLARKSSADRESPVESRDVAGETRASSGGSGWRGVPEVR
jgi:hypothetical protein